MKTAKITLFSFSIAFITTFLIACMMPASGTFLQWFPSNGTVCNYKLELGLQFTNNTVENTTLFDVYNGSSSISIYPTYMHHKLGFGETSIKNDTAVIWRYSYNDISSTQMNRTVSVIIDNVPYEKPFATLYLANSSAYGMELTTNTFPKTNFYTGVLPGEFPDYFNCSARAGDFIQSEYTVDVITDSQIIAMANQSVGYYSTWSLIANKTGRVLQLAYYDWYPLVYQFYHANSAFLTFTAINPAPAPTTPDYTIYYVYAIIGGVCFVVGILIGVAAGKSRRK